ncbi:MAG: hypothetical protein ACOY82_18310 [Pseudomonadota bacterium]
MRPIRAAIVALLVGSVVAGWTAVEASDGPPRYLLRMHDAFVLAFVDSEGFGRTRLTPMQRLRNTYRTGGATPMWVERLELIGIAKHDPPQAFSAGFDAFQHPEDSGPRPPRREGRRLSADERAALRALESGERLVVRDDADGLRVVGPISAGGECLGCHRGARAGDMLGALVYTLRPLPASAPAR